MARGGRPGYSWRRYVPHTRLDEGRPLKFGTLQVYSREGLLQEHGLDLPSAILGRGEGSHIFLDDFSISRRHARLTIDSGRLMIEDLGSANGTFVDGEKLEPGVRHLVAPDAVLRFGEIEARYLDPAAAALANRTVLEDNATEEEAPFGISLILASPSVPVDPGKNVTATLSVVNRGHLIDAVTIDVSDLPKDWFTLERRSFPLVPGERVDVPLSIHPPRDPSSLSGEYSYTVTVNSREYEGDVSAEGTFQVLPFEAVSLSFAAPRSRRKFTVIAENKGNDVVHYEFEGKDDEQIFGYGFETPSVDLQPGQKATVGLVVTRKAQWFGPAIPLPFEVVGHSSSGAEVTARGQLATNPPLQKFKLPAMYTVAAIALLATALAVLVLTDSGTKKASAEDPYAGVHLCEDANAKAKQDQKNADAATDKPITSATVVGPTDGGRPLFGESDKNGAPFFAQNDARWATQEYARSTELPNGRDWCGTTIEQCGCAMTSVSVMLALYGLLQMPDGTPLSPKTLNDWFNGNARQTDRGWVSRGYIYGDVIWSAANELSGEIAKVNPSVRTVRFVSTGSGSEEEIKAELRAGRPVVLEVPGHWIAAVGLDGDQILINDPFYRDRKTLDVYAGKVRSSVHFEPSTDLSAVVITAPADVKFRITDKEGRVVATGTGTEISASDAINQIPGASISAKKAWRDPTCIEKAPPADAGTNQITLPGGKDDYKVEIIGTGSQPGSVDIHTYAKDGKSTISTIEGEEGTKADVSYDPNADKPTINITSNGTPQATSTPNPGGGSGGGPNDDETPTPGPSVLPIPTVTQTPFVEQRTAMTLPAEPGQTRVEVATNSGFELGDPIRFAPGLPNEEDNIIVGFGSFILATPLKFSHSPGEPIQRLQRPPGQGPGLPPGVTPPPSTGPIEPPSDITLNCSTLYQANPKQATFICDATIAGGYTTTRWSLNGKVVSDFSGASSFIYAFPTDSPASISITVCNQTLCRSTTKSERIAFPGADATAAGNGSTTGGGGTNTIAPPPPAGQVAVVCGTEFPITPDGQVAQFNCQVNFSGDFTNISWSAPGGTPANKNGTSKEFTTTIKNVAGTPPSIKISATVCNFGVCRTSQPAEVGIAKTITLIDSTPVDAVNQGHSLTLMARVQGTGKSVPQGGTVQFYADGQDKDHAIGGSAPLLTSGSVAIAFTTVDTNSLSTTPQGGPGLPHAFIAVYSGGTNAFGSQSGIIGDTEKPPRIITVLPPIPDACDSVNNDGDVDNDGTIEDAVTDGTCTFSTPLDLGGGTVLNTLSITGDGTVIQDGAANAVVVDPGDVLTISGSAGRTDYCPGCIRQVYIGIGGYDPSPNLATATRIGPVCSLNGFFPPVPGGPGFTINLQAPTTPGIYYVRATTTLDYFCVGPTVGPPENSVGRIIVRQAITTQVELWDNGPLWPTAPTTQGGPPGPDPLLDPGRHQVTGISEGQRIVLRAKVPAGAVGRVEFSTTPANVLKVGGGVPSAQVCPASGFFDMPAGIADVTCVPWEARVLTDTVDAINQPFTVTAKYIDPDPLIATDPLDVQPPFDTNTYNIRYAASPSSNTAGLKVLAPAAVTVTSPTTMPVQMGSDFTLVAEVESVNTSLGLKGEGGTVQFKAGNNAFGPPVPVGADGKATLTWRAGVNPPACTPTPCGGTPFDTKDDGNRSTYNDVFAEYITGGNSLLQSACSGTNGWQQSNCFETNVDIDPAGSTVTISSVTPGNPTAGTGITIVATVTGVPDFPPTNGNVVITATGGSLLSDSGTLGNAAVVETSPGVYQATISFTTGTSGDQMDTPGNYTLTAQFQGTSSLDSSTSAGFAVTVSKEAATVALSITGAAACTAPDPVTSFCINAGGGGAAHVVVSSSDTGSLHQQSATLALYNGTSLVATRNLTSGDAGTFDFSFRGLTPGTYDLRAVYSGNNFYLGGESAPSDCSTGCVQLIVAKAGATVSLTNLTRTVDRAPTGSNSVGDTFTIIGNANPNVSVPASAGGTLTLNATINGVTTALASHVLTGGDEGQHTFTLDTSSGVLLTTSPISLTLDYSGNGVLNAGSTPTATSLTLGKADSTVVVTAPSSVTVGSTISVSVSVTAPAGITPSCPADNPGTTTVDESLCVEIRAGGASGTLITRIAVGGSVNPLTTGGASGSCLDAATTTPPCNIYAGYTLGDSLVNPGSGSANVSINKANPTLTAVATDVTIGGSSSVTVSISGLPAGVSPNCTDCMTVKVSGLTGGLVTVLSNLDWPSDNSFNLPTGSAATGAYAGTCLVVSGTCNITVEYNGNTSVNSATDTDSFTISKIVSAVNLTLTPGTIALGNTSDIAATVTVAGGGAAPNCTGCLHFRLGSATGTQIGGNRDLTGGTGTFTLTITAGTTAGLTTPGAYDIFAVYDGTSTIASSQSNGTLTINQAPTTLTATASQGAQAGSAVTLSASITSPFGTTNDIDPGTVQFKVNGVNQGTAQNVNNGAASLTLSAGTLAPGTYQITATYTGGGNYAASSDTTDFQIVVT